jgi:hypothetical protein
MKAIVVHKYGGPEVLKFEECSDPVPGQGDVLVRAAAASANPIDAERGGSGSERKGWQLEDPAVALKFSWIAFE